jgi:hypothetical protein
MRNILLVGILALTGCSVSDNESVCEEQLIPEVLTSTENTRYVTSLSQTQFFANCSVNDEYVKGSYRYYLSMR